MNRAVRIAATLIGAEIVVAASFGIAGATGHMVGTAYASETVALSDVPWIDSLPTCHEEDCSDVPNQEGVWLDRDTGNWYFEQSDFVALIVDDTAVA